MAKDTNAVAEDLFNKKLLFSTPFKIDHSIQSALLDYVIKEGYFLPPEGSVDPFWVGLGITDLADRSLLDKVAPENHGWWYYLSRLDESIEWQWNDHPAAQMVKELLAPIAPYYKRFTRITLVVQIPGMALPAHRDIVVGDTYDSMDSTYSTGKGDKKLLFKGKEWFNFDESKYKTPIHKAQNYLNLKIPISQSPSEPGKPFIRYNEDKIYYSSQNRFFFLNEVTVEHGADPCPYYRGVIFVDGLFDSEKFESLPREPIEVTGVQSSTD